MKTAIKRTVEVEDIAYKCDFCEFTMTWTPGQRMRHMPICDQCKRHMCSKHITEFDEDGGDYADARICPECLPAFQEAWDWAIEHAGRYDDLMSVVRRRLANPPHAEGIDK